MCALREVELFLGRCTHEKLSHEYCDRSCRFEEIAIPDSVETIADQCFFWMLLSS